MQNRKIIVIGAGPAGMMAAIRAAEYKADVILLEKNSSLGRKLLLSGKGRCNLTNACGLDAFLGRFSGNADFLRDAFGKFFNLELMEFFEKRGLKLKVERQERVFPVTDSSASILQVLNKELVKQNVKITTNAQVKEILFVKGQIAGVKLADGKIINASKVILATGGVSYGFTGSTGDGIRFAQKSGHRIVPLAAGLVPWEIKQKYPKLLEGLTLKNIRLRISDSKKSFESEIGELMFTSFGISGPLVFSLSAKVGDWLKKTPQLYVEIDLKPGLTQEQLEVRLLREFKEAPRKNIKNTLKTLLPMRLIDLSIATLKMDGEKQVSHITQAERKSLISLLKGFKMDIKGLKSIEDGMVTRGGVSLKDVNPRTMESRVIKGLYFAGEIMDIDADTGGFNLQAAFSTGYLAGESAAKTLGTVLS